MFSTFFQKLRFLRQQARRGNSDSNCDDSRPFFSLSRDELIGMAKSYNWVHRIELGDGYTTPGQWGPGNPEIWKAFDRVDFRNKRVLDIGCWDGLWTFEAEARGAKEVVATDLISQRSYRDDRTFEVAAALRGSKAQYIPDLSVYDVESLEKKFDVVIYTGIYYHLKDPLRAYAVLRRVMNRNARLVVEGAILPQPGCFASFYYKEPYLGDRSNWWLPTPECLRQWIQCSFFDVEWEGEIFGGPQNPRASLVAKAVTRKDPLYSCAPEHLEQFNR